MLYGMSMRMCGRTRASWVFGVLIIVGLLAGCGGSSSGSGDADGDTCTYTWQCESGLICQDGRCVPPALDASTGETPPSPDDPEEPQGPTSPQNPEEPEEPETPPTPNDPSAPKPIISESNYRLCTSNEDCAVFSGNCITEVYLSRPDLDGRTKVSLHELAPDKIDEGEGICTDTCTNDPRVCNNLKATKGGQSVPYTCQLIYAGINPYTDAQTKSVPLNETAMARGVAYASICRPPFAWSEERSDSFCQSCTQDDDCSNGSRCMIETPYAAHPAGSCVDACSGTEDCPAGFACKTIDDEDTATYCAPIADTCGRCLDADGDERGVGRCGPISAPYTDVDCDDTDSNAYYDANDPRHAFPTYCGATIDMNCNLIDDETEQLGSADHCSQCFDVCDPAVTPIENGRKSCVNVGSDAQPSYTCQDRCRSGYADCDSEPGCETQLGSQYRWYEDNDGDGYGDPATETYFCPDDTPGTGWVHEAGDCDDTRADVHPGARELCDGIDNNCNGDIDEDVYNVVTGDPTLGVACLNSAEQGICQVGTTTCLYKDNDEGVRVGTSVCAPDVDIEVQKEADELCNCIDDDCNGDVDDNIAPWGSCAVRGALGICKTGEWTCGTCHDKLDDDGHPVLDAFGRTIQAPKEVCAPVMTAKSSDRIGDNIDENCDGFDGDASKTVFVHGRDGHDNLSDSTLGEKDNPVKTIQKALTMACDGHDPCLDIAVAAGDYYTLTNKPLKIPTFANATNEATPYYVANNGDDGIDYAGPTDMNGGHWVSGIRAKVRIYGGFDVSYTNCTYDTCDTVWTRNDTNSVSTITRNTPEITPGKMGAYYAAIEGTDNAKMMSLVLDQIDVHVDNQTRTPMEVSKPWHAPSLVGIKCPMQGCALLSFRYVKIRVDAASNGSSGSREPRTSQGGNFQASEQGCLKDGDCGDKSYRNNNWMGYYSNTEAAQDWFGGENNDCSSRWTRGGNSTGFQITGGTAPMFYFGGANSWFKSPIITLPIEFTYTLGSGAASCMNGDCIAKGGMLYSKRYLTLDDYDDTDSFRSVPVNGRRGDTGIDGTYSANIVNTYFRSTAIGNNYEVTAPTRGTDGGGGGGGAGCNAWLFRWNPVIGNIYRDNLEIICEEKIKKAGYRGGGGGAGGCGGDAGINGGFGGSIFGIVLISEKATPARIEIAPLIAHNQTFSVDIGSAGDGGNGTGGQSGQTGQTGAGIPGVSGSVGEYVTGGNGGSGGGGGGGAGGSAGLAAALAIQCAGSEPCEPLMPAQMNMALSSYFIAPQNAAHGGVGGRAGCTGNVSCSGSSPSDGEDGADGNVYVKHHF